MCPAADQFLDDGGADEPGRAGNKDTHDEVLRVGQDDKATIGARSIGVK